MVSGSSCTILLMAASMAAASSLARARGFDNEEAVRADDVDPPAVIRERRIPSGFLSMRGRRGEYNEDQEGFLDEELDGSFQSQDKRGSLGSRGFMGMRGKKVPSSFMGMRGKKSPSSFYGMPEKKSYDYHTSDDDSLSSLVGALERLQQDKRARLGFMGMRG